MELFYSKQEFLLDGVKFQTMKGRLYCCITNPNNAQCLQNSFCSKNMQLSRAFRSLDPKLASFADVGFPCHFLLHQLFLQLILNHCVVFLPGI